MTQIKRAMGTGNRANTGIYDFDTLAAAVASGDMRLG